MNAATKAQELSELFQQYDTERLPTIRRALRKKRLSKEETEHLDTLHKLFVGFPEEHIATLLTDIIEMIGFNDKESIRILVEHREYLRENPLDGEDIVQMHKSLRDKHGIKPDTATGQISSVPDHLAAQEHYTRQYIAQDGYSFPLHYLGNRVYVAAVERHRDKLDNLMAYRELRGIKVTGMSYSKVDHFNESDFQEYLVHGALADGFL